MKQKKIKRWFFHCISMKKIMILLISISWMAPIVAQELQISGIITDSNSGETLPGVSIKAEGTNTGAISDVNGKYVLKTQKNSIIEFSFMGYISQSVTIVDQTTIDVVLVADVKKLNEIIVVGYGVQRKEAVTGSVASIRGDVLREMPSANISQALQGRVAGVDMEQTSSKPGAEMQIRIRGVRSLNASNDPLVVLDGIPFAGSIGDLDPNDIKSIDILKDASATAIYGSRGANGVLLVTTNKGKNGQKARVSYNGYYGLKSVFAKYPMMNGSEFAKLRAAAGTAKNTLDESDTNNTDWQDLLYKTGTLTNHELGLSGGNEKGNYNAGMGYYRDEAVVPLQNYTRYSLRTSIDQEVSGHIRLGFSTNTNYAITNGYSLGSVGTALASSPLANIYNADGSLKRSYLQATSGAQWVSTRTTLEALGDQYIDQTRALSTYNTAFGEVKIPGVEGLKYRANIGLNYRQSNYGNYVGQGVFSGNASTLSSAAITNEHTLNWAIENLLTYDRTFAEKHMFNVVVLYSSEQTTYYKSHVSATDIPSDAFQFYNLGYANVTPTVDPSQQDYKMSGLMSWMGRAMYSYDDRYMLGLTYRSDASSRLAAGHKWHSYPAISAGWNIMKESFMSGLTMIDNLKLRVGYGQTSNQAVDPYKTLGLLSTQAYNFGPTTYSTGYYVSQLPNTNLGWEFSETWNYGLDFSLLKHRLSGTVEYYAMNTKNVLLDVNLAPTSGVSSYTANVGKTQNKGWELTLNGVILDNPNGLTWEVGFNLYANHNKLVALSSGRTNDKSNWWFVGHPINVIYDYKKVGLWQQNDQYMSTLEPGGNVGMIKVQYTGTYNADGSPTRAIGADDQQVMDLEPNFQGGFNTRIGYKGFDLSVVGAFQNGGILNSTLYGSGSYLNNDNARSSNNVKIDYWTPTNTGAKYPKPGGIGGDNPKYGSTLGYFSASYLKIRTISFGYNFMQKWMKSVGAQNLRLYCTVQNPFVFFSPYKNESGMDPETNSYGNENAAVPLSSNLKRLLTLGTNTPSTRNYLVGINLTF
jgi:TonB-dependent starch-binding outer membrane protein SusC